DGVRSRRIASSEIRPHRRPRVGAIASRLLRAALPGRAAADLLLGAAAAQGGILPPVPGRREPAIRRLVRYVVCRRSRALRIHREALSPDLAAKSIRDADV